VREILTRQHSDAVQSAGRRRQTRSSCDTRGGVTHLDTHAGRGWYDLRAEDATRGGEWREGIARLASRPAQSADLLRYLQATHAAGATPTHYPGSPVLALEALRAGDRAVLIEQQPAEAQALDS
jgi:23S rRNA (adenine2030-N6)-methyltransferase